MKEELKKIITDTVVKMGIEVPDFSVEVPADKTHGDYATNVALALSKKLGKNPREVANDIIVNIGAQKFLEKIEVAGPGFINFYLSKGIFVEGIKQALKNPKQHGSNHRLRGMKLFIEHTQPNPFKEFHIGHLMNNAIGESLARIIKYNGATVTTATYHGDVGLHVAKAIWALQKGIALNQAYAYGHKEYEEDEAAKQEIIDINKKVYERRDTTVLKLYQAGKKESLKRFAQLYKQLGSQFNYHFYESEAGEIGKKLVLHNVGKIFSNGENGAIIFEGEKFEPKTHTRVFLNSEALPTYEAKEVGLAKIKKDKVRYDKSITITANEQDSFFNVVEVAIGQVFPELRGKLQHLSHGILKLPSGKMSSRTGTIISAESMIQQVQGSVMEKIADRGFSEKEQQAVSEIVAIGALKYSILKQTIGSDIIFDLEKSVSFDGDSGPYLQYSYVRALSVLQKAKGEKIKPALKNIPEITELEKMMVRFPEIVQRAAEEYEPHIITLYLTELAREFNNYYAHHKIVDRGDEYSPYKVALTQAFSVIMKNGLWLLGIKAPEKM